MTNVFVRLHWKALMLLAAVASMSLVLLQFGPVGAQEDIEDDELELIYFVTPKVIQKGERVLLEWEAPGADYCVATDDWQGTKSAVGSENKSPKKFKKYTYTLECYTNEGEQTGEVSRSVTVVKKKSAKAPLPSVNFRTNRTSVEQGGTVTLSWKTKNAVGCRAMGPDGWDGLKMASGKEVISPDNAATYTLRCWNQNLKYSDDQSVSIDVRTAPLDNKSGYLYGPPSGYQYPPSTQTQQSNFGPSLQQPQFGPPPPTFPSGYFQSPTYIYTPSLPQPVRISFKPSKYKFYDAGEPIVLSWNARYATACIASGDWSGDRPIEGSEHVRPNDTSEYKLTCYNSDTSSDSVASIQVTKVKKKVTGSVGLSFSPARSIIYTGKEVTLSWNASNAVSCVASGSWSGEKSLVGSLTVNPTKPETYYLDCKNDTHSKRKSATIDIFKEEPKKETPQPAPQPEQKPEYKPVTPTPAPVAQSVLRVGVNMAVPRATFKPGAVDVTLGSMIVTNGSDNPVYFEDLAISDADGTDGLGKSFTNLKLLTTGGVQMGSTLPSLPLTPGAKISFTGHGVLVPARGSVTLTLKADVLFNASLQDALRSDALKVVSAIENDQKGGKIAVAQLPVDLQRFALDVAVPEVSVNLDASSPLAASVEAGTLQVELGKFKIMTTEGVAIRSIGVELSPFTAGLLKNLSVYQGTTLLGSMPDVTSAKTTLPLRLVLEKNNMTVVSIKADFAAGVATATKFKIGIADFLFEPDAITAVQAAKTVSTLPVFANDFTATPKPAATAPASTSTQTTSTSAT